MKTLLAILLGFVISEAPVLAIHGGYTLNGSASVVGTYAGILVPTTDVALVSGAKDLGKNSLGLFTLSVPNQGLGSGNAVIFADGQTFTGNIQVLPDPESQTGIRGVIDATFNYNLFVTLTGSAGDTVQTESITATLQGSFNASTVQNPQSSGGLGLDLDGTSEVNVDQGFVSGSNGTPILTEQITYAIEGFQQSTTASASSTSGT